MTGYEKDLQRQLKKSGSDDEVQFTERFAKSGYDFIITAGHGFLVVPYDSPDIGLAKKIVKYGYEGAHAIYLEEDGEAPEFLSQCGMIHPAVEDIYKYGTKDEIVFLLENWRGKLQGEYNNFEEFKQYDEVYGLSKRLGFNSPEEAWEANPLIQGGVNPKDYKVVKDFHRVKVCARCGKKLKRGERGGVCDMCADDIDKGRDKE